MIPVSGPGDPQCALVCELTGPDLDEVLPGQSAAEIEEDIVDPNKEIAKGYPANVMPQNFGETIPPEELEALVEYLQEVAGEENFRRRTVEPTDG